LNGDPVDDEVLANFAFEVHARWRRGRGTIAERPRWTARRARRAREPEALRVPR
jgi:hypothetical protein